MSAPLHPNREAVADPTIQRQDRGQRRLRYLQRAINTSYDTVLQSIAFDGLTIELLRVADVDTLLDRLPPIQFRPDERLPYWADLWPSSLALAKQMWEVIDLEGLRVLELGCGIGLVGIVASRKGGLVTCTDYEADALAFTRYNVLHNGCQHVVVQHLDWHAPALSRTYDLIVAADVLYERRNFMPLLHILMAALAPEGRFMLAEPNRPVARDFFRLLRDRGFRYERATENVESGGERHAISIYRGGRKRVDHGASG